MVHLRPEPMDMLSVISAILREITDLFRALVSSCSTVVCDQDVNT